MGKKIFPTHERNFKTGTDEWLTPPSIIKALGPFDLDPCSPGAARAPWPTASRMIGLPTDGLSVPWHGRIWLNPPYGDETGMWLEKLADHGDGIALVFARTETTWFHEFVWPRASGLFFFRRRLRFHTVNGKPGESSAGAPSVLVAFGQKNNQALEALKTKKAKVLRGHHLTLSNPIRLRAAQKGTPLAA